MLSPDVFKDRPHTAAHHEHLFPLFPRSERDDQAAAGRDPAKEDWVFNTIKPNKIISNKVPNGAAGAPAEAAPEQAAPEQVLLDFYNPRLPPLTTTVYLGGGAPSERNVFMLTNILLFSFLCLGAGESQQALVSEPGLHLLSAVF